MWLVVELRLFKKVCQTNFQIKRFNKLKTTAYYSSVSAITSTPPGTGNFDLMRPLVVLINF